MPGLPPESGCWDWVGSASNGYGELRFGTRLVKATHISHRIYIGPVQRGLMVRHRCDRPICVQPQHLILGTQVDNMGDAAERARMPRGLSHHNGRLTDDDVREIRQRWAAGQTRDVIAAAFDISDQTAYCIGTRRKRVHVPDLLS